MFQFKTKLDYIFFIGVSMLFLISLIIMSPQVSMIDSDAYWHIENGRYMIENKVILD